MKSSTENIMATESGDSAEEMSINEACLPQKKFYRQRAHSNPLSKWVVFIYVYYFWILLINRLLYSRWPLIWLVSFVPWMKIYIFNKKNKSQQTYIQNNSPTSPSDKDWSVYYDFNNPNNSFESNEIKFADIGCGYGGLLIKLSEMYPHKLSLGMEIRVKVSDYVQDRIKALRIQCPNKYNNIACLRSNAMKYLPNFFRKGQVISV